MNPIYSSYDIVTACRLKDFKTLCLALPRLRKFLPHRRLVVFTSRGNICRFSKDLGGETECIDEDTVFPDLKLERLKKEIRLPEFPQGAGWYFQQFLKLSYSQIRPDVDRYLIWDADTIPLRCFSVFGPDGKALLTPASLEASHPPRGVVFDPETTRKMQQATQLHLPYFENYQNLFGENPFSSMSFIAQQMPIHVPTLRAMIGVIEQRFQGQESWPWKILKNLKGKSGNLFSEYETYAQFALRHAPEFHAVRPLVWSRAGRLKRWPSAATQLTQWAEEFDYVALERWASPVRRGLVQIFNYLPEGMRWWLRKGR